MNDAFEGTDDAGDDLVEFTCPYNCGKSIRMKERNVIKNKCTDCRSHPLKCDGVRADGDFFWKGALAHPPVDGGTTDADATDDL